MEQHEGSEKPTSSACATQIHDRGRKKKRDGVPHDLTMEKVVAGTPSQTPKILG
jgi:hypothetical protein